MPSTSSACCSICRRSTSAVRPWVAGVATLTARRHDIRHRGGKPDLVPGQRLASDQKAQDVSHLAVDEGGGRT